MDVVALVARVSLHPISIHPCSFLFIPQRRTEVLLVVSISAFCFHFETMSLRFFQLFPLLFLVSSFWGEVSLALAPPGHHHQQRTHHRVSQTLVSKGAVPVQVGKAGPTILYMQGDDESADAVSQDQEQQDDDPVEETSEPTEDPEVVALKEEIASLESQLKSKKSSLSYALDQVEEYSKAGYARAVAEMENMRRVRSSMNSSNKSNAMAGVLRDFLPVYDTLNALKEKYANDEFGSKYGGLSIGPTFAKMGIKEFSISEGEALDLIRMNVVGSEYSGAAKDTVIAQVAPGMDLEGNVIRAAQCITSLGSEEIGAEESPSKQ